MKAKTNHLLRKILSVLIVGLFVMQQCGLEVFADQFDGNDVNRGTVEQKTRDPKVNPSITIQHYLYFSAVSLGSLESATDSTDNRVGIDEEHKRKVYTGVTYNERVKNDWEDSPWESDLRQKDEGTTLPIYNTERRIGSQKDSNGVATVSGIPDNGADSKPGYGVVLNNEGKFSSHLRLKQLFLDETVNYLEKPQMPYMNRLYDSEKDNNANYMLREIWVSKPGASSSTVKNNPSTQDANLFFKMTVPLKYKTDGQKEVVGHIETTNEANQSVSEEVYRRDPSRVIFTNNPEYSLNGKKLDQENGEVKPTYFGDENSNSYTLVIPVSEDTTIRFAFDPTDGEVSRDADFFDYDISDGNPAVSGNTQTMNTGQQGINHPNNYANTGKPKVAFGNVNTGSGLGNQVLTTKGVVNYINRFNLANGFPTGAGKNNDGTYKETASPDQIIPKDGQGAVFGLAKGMNEENESLIWSENVDAPAVFTPGAVLAGKTDYLGDLANNKGYSLEFKRSGNTYVLEGVKNNATGVQAAGNLSQIKKDQSSVFTNNFWPMDNADSYGTAGHDIAFGDKGKLSQRKFSGQGANAAKVTNNTTNEGRNIDQTAAGELPQADSKTDHNSFFGMNFNVDFYLDPGYAGPLRYYFYGDDDMFVFLSEVNEDGTIKTGTTKQIADVGGVHSSVGMYVNLWNHIGQPIPYKNTQGEANKMKRYRLTFFYSERGASGSTCYMRFTVPFQSMKTREMKFHGTVQIEKEVKGTQIDSGKDYSFQVDLKYPHKNDADKTPVTIEQIKENPELFDDCEPLVNHYRYEVYQKGENGQEDTLVGESKEKDDYVYDGSKFTLKHNQYMKIYGLPGSMIETQDTDGTEPADTEQKEPSSTLYRIRELDEDGKITTTFASGTVENGESKIHTEFNPGKEVSDSTGAYNYVKFINATEPAVLNLKKIVDGEAPDRDFEFKLKFLSEDKPLEAVALIIDGIEQPDLKLKDNVFTVKLKANQTATIYNLPKGTKYEIVESADDQFIVSGIETSGNGTTGETLLGTASTTGSMASTDQPLTDITYTNVFAANTSAVLNVNKKLSGRTGVEGETFDFELSAANPAAETILPQSITTTVTMADKEEEKPASFDALRFTEPGEYWFDVKELIPDTASELDHMTYDKTIYRAVIQVDEADDGILSTTVTLAKGKDADEPVTGDTMEFTNVFKPETSQIIGFTKNIEGTPVEGHEYTFVISPAKDAPSDIPMPAEDERTVTLTGDGKKTILNGAFGSITYDKKGTYKYEVTETKGTVENLHYDETVYTVTVTVSDDDRTPEGRDALKAEITAIEPASETNAIGFTNVYRETAASIPFTKTLQGREMNDSDRFEFVLTDKSGEAVLDTQVVSGKETASTVSGTFNALSYTKAGTYEYKVKETKLNAESMDYDQRVYDVTVKVDEDEATHQLNTPVITYEVDGDTAESIQFVNVFKTQTFWAPTVTKQMIGGSPAGFEFTMDVKSEDDKNLEHITLPETMTAVSGEDGRISFESILFTQPGTYTVTVTEQTSADSDPEIVYDNHKAVFTVEIVRDSKTGALEPVIQDTEGSNVFTNDAGLRIEKILAPGNNAVLTEKDLDREFKFVLSLDATGRFDAVRSDGQTLKVGNGSEFTLKGGQYLRIYGLPIGTGYSVNEEPVGGYLMTNSQGTSGNIGANTELTATFTNVKLGVGSGVIEGYKTLTNTEGSSVSLKDQKYWFRIEHRNSTVTELPKASVEEETEANENTDQADPADTADEAAPVADTKPMPSEVRVTHDEFGHFQFPPITYTQPGIHEYEIYEEVVDEDDTVLYDESRFTATVTVEARRGASGNVDGVEVTDVKYTKSGTPVDHMEFSNVYIGRPAIEIHKSQSVAGGNPTTDTQTAKAGDLVTYYLTVSVPAGATAPARDVVVTDTVPFANKGGDEQASLIFVKGSQGNGIYDEATGKITWNLGMLTPGQAPVTLSYTVQIPAVDKSTSWTNIAYVNYSNNPDQDPNKPDIPSEDVTVKTNPSDPFLKIEKRQAKNNDALTTDTLQVEHQDIVTYELTVTNTGSAQAENVTVSDTVPAGLELIENSISDQGTADRNGTITWKIGSLAANSSTSVSFRVRVPRLEKKTEWQNTGYVKYDNPPADDPRQEDDIPSNEVLIEGDVPAIDIEKWQSVNDKEFVKDLQSVEMGDIVTYKLVVSNKGNATAKNVTVTDVVPEGLIYVPNSVSAGGSYIDGRLAWFVGDIPAGDTKEVWFKVKVPSVTGYTKWINEGKTKYENNPEGPDSETPSNPVEIETDAPALSIVKTQQKNDEAPATPILVDAGDTITYSLTVSNNGKAAAKDVVVKDPVPEGLELVENSISDGGTAKDGVITWNLGTLSAGASKSVTFKVTVPKVTEATTWINAASTTYSNREDPEDPIPSNEVESKTDVPHLVIEKEQQKGEGDLTKDLMEVNGGDVVTYYVTVTNDGNAEAKDVKVTDTVPEGLNLVDGSISDKGTVKNGVITWKLGNLAKGEKRPVSFKVNVPEEQGMWRNIAYTSYPNNPDNEDGEDPKEEPSNPVDIIEWPEEGPKLLIDKTQALNNGTLTSEVLKGKAGDVVTYALTVRNVGKTTAEGITVTDVVPKGLSYVNGSASHDAVYDNGKLTWYVETLEPGISVTLKFQAKLPMDNAAGSWKNVATLTYQNDPEGPEHETPSNEVEVKKDPNKVPTTSTNGKPHPGASAPTATNTGILTWTLLAAGAATGAAGLGIAGRRRRKPVSRKRK